MREARSGFTGFDHVVLEQEQEEAGSIRWWYDASRLRIFRRQADSVVI
jgi:hypothetical protein